MLFLTQNFKDLAETKYKDEDRSLEEYLKENLYKDFTEGKYQYKVCSELSALEVDENYPSINENGWEDKWKDSIYRQQAVSVIEKVIKLSGLNNFKTFYNNFDKPILPGTTRNDVNNIKNELEKICFRLEQDKNINLEEFKRIVDLSTFNACPAGAADNLSVCLRSMKSSDYDSKHKFIYEIANECVREKIKLKKPGNDVHLVKKLFNAVSVELKLTPLVSDTHVRFPLPENDEDFPHTKKFKEYLENYLNSKKAAKDYIDLVIQNYTFPDEKDLNSTILKAWQQLRQMCEDCGVQLDEVIEEIEGDNHILLYKYNKTPTELQEMSESLTILKNIESGIIETKLKLSGKDIFEPASFMFKVNNKWFVYYEAKKLYEEILDVNEFQELTYKDEENNTVKFMEDYILDQLKKRCDQHNTANQKNTSRKINFKYLLNEILEEMNLALDRMQRKYEKESMKYTEKLFDKIINDSSTNFFNQPQDQLIKYNKLIGTIESIKNKFSKRQKVDDKEDCKIDLNWQFKMHAIETLYLLSNGIVSLDSTTVNKMTGFDIKKSVWFITQDLAPLYFEYGIRHYKSNNKNFENNINIHSCADYVYSPAIHYTGVDGVTPLMRAILTNQLEVAKGLIAKIKELNSERQKEILDAKATEQQFTALMAAAKAGHAEIVDLLIGLGALVDLRDKFDTTALMMAARAGHAEIVEILINAKADPHAKGPHNFTALMMAAKAGHAKIVKILIDTKVDPHAKGPHNFTALMIAAREGHTKIVKILIDAKVDLDAQDSNNYTALMHVAKKGDTKTLQILINAKANPNVRLGDKGMTALMFAVDNDKLEAVKMLLLVKANVNYQYAKGMTALMLALKKNNVEISETLLANEADLNLINDDKRTALDLAAGELNNLVLVKKILQYNPTEEIVNKAFEAAIIWDNIKIVKWFIDSCEVGDFKTYLVENAQKFLITSAVEGSKKVFKYLIDNRKNLNLDLNVNAQDQHGKLAWHHAVEECQVEILKYLIDNREHLNLDIDAKGRDGKIALNYAFDSTCHLTKKLNTVKFLIEAGANPRARGFNNETVLMSASKQGHLQIVKYLIEQNAAHLDGVLDRDDSEKTVFHHAVEKGKVEILEYLKDELEDDLKDKFFIEGLTIRDNSASTPLNYILNANINEKQKLLAVKFLIEAGANAQARGFNNETPLMSASKQGYLKIVQYLIHEGSLDDQDNNGDTALMLASKGGTYDNDNDNHFKIVRYLVEKGANVLIRNNDQKSACHLCPETLKVLKKFLTETQKAQEDNAQGEQGNDFNQIECDFDNFKESDFDYAKHGDVDIAGKDNETNN
ncbi:MAG: ankyrin repeat domain-containing protein [Rickettsiaceae bacterium]|nr:ankyrin repeat domain-containing protein [Rickettsiaceae bacterium]